jgi:hypothetical protein
MNNILEDQFVFNPTTKYYFISAQRLGKAPAWIRMPFQTAKEVREFASEYILRPKLYGNLEIFDEQTLDTMVSVKDGEQDIQVTLRTCLFGSFYEEYAKDVKDGVCEIEV